MGTPYAGNEDNYPSTITVLDDGDNADASGIGAAAFEGLKDAAAWLRKRVLRTARLHPLGAMRFASTDARFVADLTDASPGDYNFLSVHTETSVGGEGKWSLHDVLAQGTTLASIDVLFIPKASGRSGGTTPGTPPTVTLIRWSMVVGDTPDVAENLGSETYTPVDPSDYVNGEFKAITLNVGAHAVDDSYVYQLVITDESGANAIVGNTYLAFRVNYA